MTTHLFEAAKQAMAKAHAPYSRFPVGAAILAEDGSVHSGCNIEIVSFPEGWCAETSAIARMVMAGGSRKIAEVAVVAEKLVACSPCGGCRQRLAEFSAPSTRVHLCDVTTGVVETVTMGELLPHSFATDSLEVPADQGSA
ncbi:cytidine deaminase [Jiella pacifica]|uniref:Cytidine deaminase n=1 Tax=Jiella pacifica TaxID=2696469 RepID=A0A6N9SZY1_9HYPH|nr:cytidine deaminase [Jiella pacifica]NDW04673.1 cytidine deaminase [Jiella pacifica]